MDPFGDGLCLYLLDMLWVEKGIRDNCFHEVAFPCFRASTPRSVYKCASLLSIPRGKWYCKYCQKMFQREKFVEHNANAVAAGRVSGVDLIEQITKRCIQIVKNPEDVEVIASVLCRGYQFRKSGFGPHTVIVCDKASSEITAVENKRWTLNDFDIGKPLGRGKFGHV